MHAKAWSDDAHCFLQRCADAGNLEACYLIGMIRFYCLGSRSFGAALMAAVAGGHREALYSLAVIQFNGGGKASAAAAAASRRHACLLSDLGCRAAAAAAGEAHAANRFLVDWFASRPLAAQAAVAGGAGTVAAAAGSAEDDGAGGALRLYSQALCGRPETRWHEFRRCSVCSVVNYCSRACQALQGEYTPMDREET